MAVVIGVPQRRLAVWERGEECPGEAPLKRVLDLMHRLPSELLAGVSQSVVRCELPRALSRTSQLNLQALSGPAIDKRPTIVEWIGENLAPIACGVLKSMLDDAALQRGIANRDIAGVVATTRSVLRTTESDEVGMFRTTINYFFHDGVLYSDAIAVPAPAGEPVGYTAIAADEIGSDLFGDRHVLEAALMASRAKALRPNRS